MSDFLDSLIDRSLSAGPAPSATLRPLLPSRFEPPRATPLFGSAAWDSSPDVNHDDTADRSSSPFAFANNDTTPRIASVTSGDWDRDDTRSPSPFPPLATGTPEDDLERRLRPTGEQPRADDALASAPRMSQSLAPDDNSWLHRRMDDMTVQLQRLRGDMAPPSPVRSTSNVPELAVHDDRAGTTRSVVPHAAESATPERRLAPAFDEAARGERGSYSGAMRTTPSQSDEHHSQQLSLSPGFGQLDQLLALAGRAAMQPPPRIQPEDLPSSRQPAPVEKTINVTIGRVEVKATREPTPVRRPAPSQASSSVMSLDDYLKQRAAGGL